MTISREQLAELRRLYARGCDGTIPRPEMQLAWALYRACAAERVPALLDALDEAEAKLAAAEERAKAVEALERMLRIAAEIELQYEWNGVFYVTLADGTESKGDDLSAALLAMAAACETGGGAT